MGTMNTPTDPHLDTAPQATDEAIFAIERPHPKLLRLYLLRSLLSGPAIVLTLPILLFRYQTLRYHFDDEGIAMKWGLLFRREVTLTYARIQDIHLHAGFVQRFFGLADLMIQTASGSAGAEMTLEGLLEYDAVRDFLYRRMRGVRDPAAARANAADVASGLARSDETVALLRSIRDDLAAVRAAVGQRDGGAQ